MPGGPEERDLRLFVAIELPAPVKDALAALIEELERAALPGLRPARPEGIHLTLKFLGDVGQDRVDSLVDALSTAAARVTAFTLDPGSPGVFPGRASPRVLWIGIDGDLDKLSALQREADEALAAVGFGRESREFRAHLTVARIREGTARADRRAAADLLFSTPIEPGLRISVDHLSLMRSTLLPSGAVYECLARVALAGHLPEQMPVEGLLCPSSR